MAPPHIQMFVAKFKTIKRLSMPCRHTEGVQVHYDSSLKTALDRGEK